MSAPFIAAIRKRRDFLILSGDYGNQIVARALDEMATILETVEKEQFDRADSQTPDVVDGT